MYIELQNCIQTVYGCLRVFLQGFGSFLSVGGHHTADLFGVLLFDRSYLMNKLHSCSVQSPGVCVCVCSYVYILRVWNVHMRVIDNGWTQKHACTCTYLHMQWVYTVRTCITTHIQPILALMARHLRRWFCILLDSEFQIDMPKQMLPKVSCERWTH